MFFFTADEHYGHANIIKYCNRPWQTVEEMNEELIRFHNSAVGPDDTVIHAGDFALCTASEAESIVSRLNGTHVFLHGSHDSWLPRSTPMIWRRSFGVDYIVVCHYAMRVWPRSRYNSWQLYGHSHGKLAPIGKQWDIGVDNNNFGPVSFEWLGRLMRRRPDNPDLAV